MYTTYDIFDDILGLRNSINRYFDEHGQGTRKLDYPHINLYEKENTVTIQALIPGVAASEIAIHLVDNSLIIEGERKPDYADLPYIRRERSFGRFKKSVRMPYRVDREGITATMKDGVLTIKLSKSPDALPRTIQIK